MQTEKRIEVRQWNAVALWSWNVAVENCAICKNSINQTCLECQGNQNAHAETCMISWGACNHAYHTHCISRWTAMKKDICPLCQRQWITVKTAKQ